MSHISLGGTSRTHRPGNCHAREPLRVPQETHRVSGDSFHILQARLQLVVAHPPQHYLGAAGKGAGPSPGLIGKAVAETRAALEAVAAPLAEKTVAVEEAGAKLAERQAAHTGPSSATWIGPTSIVHPLPNNIPRDSRAQFGGGGCLLLSVSILQSHPDERTQTTVLRAHDQACHTCNPCSEVVDCPVSHIYIQFFYIFIFIHHATT